MKVSEKGAVQSDRAFFLQNDVESTKRIYD